MSGLLETFATQASPSNLDPTVRSLGIDAPRLSQGLRLAGPLLTSGLARAASAPAGADALMRLLSTQVSDEPSAIETSEGEALAQLAFGASRHTVARAASQALGFDARPLLVAAAPRLRRLLRQRGTEQGLDSAGRAQTLADETAAFVSQGGPQADAVEQVWASVDALEGLRRRFTERVLDTVGEAPLAVTALVMGVAPSTGGNVRKELAAAARVIDGAEDLAGALLSLTCCPRGVRLS